MNSKLRKSFAMVLAFVLSFSLIALPGCGSPKDAKINEFESRLAKLESQAAEKETTETTTELTVIEETTKVTTTATTTIETTIEEEPAVTGELKVSYIDVGQGDSILIQQDEEYMLIDAGENGDAVVSYLNNEGVTKLDYLIATHPNADHIGGMADVVNSFDLDTVIMSEVTHTSQTFENLLDALLVKDQKITKPEVGKTYDLGEANFQILAPNSSNYENLNNYSVAIRITFGENSFIFTGDAESRAENEIVNNNLDIESDVLKIAHHGSNTSSTTNFLDNVNPSYAVIMCATGNQYGHPHQEVIDSLTQSKIEIYRTDVHGTIIAISDGKNITFTTEKDGSDAEIISPGIIPTTAPTTVAPTAPPTTTLSPATEAPVAAPVPQSYEVYITNTGAKYHRAGCRYLSKSMIPIDKDTAIAQGYTPCSVCNP